MMKRTAYLVNNSRGPLVENSGLIKALRENLIAGAALDVIEGEPNSIGDFAKLENVILTPHVSWYSEESMIDLRSRVAKTAAIVLERKVPTNAVNPEATKNSSWFDASE